MAVAAIVLALFSGACVADRTEGAPSATASGTGVRHVVFDTDLAFDDIMALLYLLQRDDVAIDAVTITGTGEAHCDPGVRKRCACWRWAATTTRPSRAGGRRRCRGATRSPTSGGRPWTTCPCWTCLRWIAWPIRAAPRAC
jgi:hypothetical protein